MSSLPINLIKVVIADDSTIARISLRSMLEDMPEVLLVGEASNGPGVIQLCLQLHPDVVLLDIRMPGIDGIKVTHILAHMVPALRVIIVTMASEPVLVFEAIHAGARGYLLKDMTRNELETALHNVSQGKLYLSLQLDVETLQAPDPGRHRPAPPQGGNVAPLIPAV